MGSCIPLCCSRWRRAASLALAGGGILLESWRCQRCPNTDEMAPVGSVTFPVRALWVLIGELKSAGRSGATVAGRLVSVPQRRRAWSVPLVRRGAFQSALFTR